MIRIVHYDEYRIKKIEPLPKAEWAGYLIANRITYRGKPFYKSYLRNVRMLREELGNPYCVVRDFEFDYKGEHYLYTESVESDFVLAPCGTVTKKDGD